MLRVRTIETARRTSYYEIDERTVTVNITYRLGQDQLSNIPITPTIKVLIRQFSGKLLPLHKRPQNKNQYGWKISSPNDYSNKFKVSP